MEALGLLLCGLQLAQKLGPDALMKGWYVFAQHATQPVPPVGVFV